MNSLKRSLGLMMLTFYGTGMILGAGIYSIIGQAAGSAGETLWQGFAMAAVAALLTALSYAELSTMFPQAGGEYIYIRNAFRSQRGVAATIGILVAFAGCATAAAVAMSFASYLGHFVELPKIAVAAALLVVFSAVNILGIKQSSWVNALFTIVEGSGLILFIWLGYQNPKFGEAFLLAPHSGTLASAALIVFAFFGFENIVNLSEETKDPEKNIPRAILLSVGISTALYILVSLAALALMEPASLAQTESALTDASMKSSPRIAGVLGGIALFSTANTVLIALVTTSRILYGIAKDKSISPLFAKTLPKKKTPWFAALIVLAVSAALLLLKSVESAASASSFATMIAFIGVNVSLIKLRMDEPKTKRPFRVPLAIGRIPVLPVLGILTCLVLLSQFESQIYQIGLIAVFASGVVYFVSQKLSR